MSLTKPLLKSLAVGFSVSTAIFLALYPTYPSLKSLREMDAYYTKKRRIIEEQTRVSKPKIKPATDPTIDSTTKK